MADLSRKRDQLRLAVQREPHWQKLIPGGYLGFRRGPDTWIARYRKPGGAGGQNYRALIALEYDAAKIEAERFFKDEMKSRAVRSVRRGTVRDALETYLTLLRDDGREDAARISQKRFELIVWPDPLAEIKLADLTSDDMREWRDRLRPGREARSVNRHVRSVIAGLNRALAAGHVGNPEAWRLSPLADEIEDAAETAIILDAEHRRALIESTESDAAAFFRGLELTGARPGELAAATVADFNPRDGILILRHRKGRPVRLRARSVQLSDDGTGFFKAMAHDKLPPARLFIDKLGNPWDRHKWNRAIRDAKAKHNSKARGADRIDPRTSAYSFRHARISELLQVHRIDPVTVAAQVGSSVRMLEQAYFKFIPAAMRERLAEIREA